MIDKKLEGKLKELEQQLGYLNVDLYDKHRGEYPSSDTIKKVYGSTLKNMLDSLKIKSKEEYLVEKNRPTAIGNMKLLYLEHGEVSKALYDKAKMLPSSEYITKKYGWDEIAKEANVKLANAQYTSDTFLLNDLKLSIKELGYIPTSKEYETLKIKPSLEILRKHGYTFVNAMRKCGYRTYNKPVKVKDKICNNKDCFKQFTPHDDELYCESCYKDMRARIVKELDKMGQQRLKEICASLIYATTKQKAIIDIFGNM